MPLTKQRAALLLGGTLGAIVAGYGLASVDRCGAWPALAPAVIAEGHATGALSVGAARLPLEPPFPVTVGGYGPIRSTARASRMPLHARAVALQVGDVKVGIVTLDALLVPDALVARIREEAASLGFSDIWIIATHAHSSFGQYDARWLAELAGTGRFRREAADALVAGGVAALRASLLTLAPARMEAGEASAAELVRPRSGKVADARLSVARFVAQRAGDEGKEPRALAQLVFFSAHPTLAPRRAELLDPDYPGALAAAREAEDGITLFLPASIGNASAVSVAETAAERLPEAFARRLADTLSRIPRGEVRAPVELAFARVVASLPRPDASRAVPSALRALIENLYCDALPKTAEVSVLRVGRVMWLAVPGEPTFAAAGALESATGASRTVGLTNGYAGYVEAPDQLGSGEGEGRRQYYAPALLSTLADAARLAAERAR